MKTFTYKVDRFEFIVNCSPNGDGRYNCFIPAYDIFFSAKSEDMIEKKATIMVQMWFNHFRIK